MNPLIQKNEYTFFQNPKGFTIDLLDYLGSQAQVSGIFSVKFRDFKLNINSGFEPKPFHAFTFF